MKLDTALSRNLLTWSEMARDFVQFGHQLREKLFPGSHQNYVLILFPRGTIVWAKVYIFAVNNHCNCSSWLWHPEYQFRRWHDGIWTLKESRYCWFRNPATLGMYENPSYWNKASLNWWIFEASTVMISVSVSWETKKKKLWIFICFCWFLLGDSPFLVQGLKKKHASQRGHGLRYWWNFRRSWKGDEGGGPVGSICR